MSASRGRVLVTGSEGFIGSHLIEELLERGYEVRAFVQYNFRNQWGWQWGWLDTLKPGQLKQIEVVAGDLRDPFCVKKATQGCRKVFHLGALIAIPYSYQAPNDYVQTNVIGTLNVLQAALDEGADQVLHTSTSEVYGTAIYAPIDEKHPLQGQSPYSASKIGADKLAESYHLSFGLPVTTIRPFNTYGPRQSARAVIPTIISQALAEKEIRLGSLSPIRDLTFVKDTARGFALAAESPQSVGHVINLGQGDGVSIGELAQRILMLMKVDKPIVTQGERVRPEKSEVFKLISDNRKAAATIGWKPEVSLDEGLRTTIEWLSSNLGHYKTGIYNV
jgi:NAD dependent epimerase/dehydratase